MKYRGKIVTGAATLALLGGALTFLGGSAQADETVTVRTGDFIPSLSATRANGVVTVGDNGLGLATWAPAAPVSPSPDKAAEYWDANYSLDSVDAGSMVVHGGPQKPGINLYVDMDDDTATHMAGSDGYKGADAILVGEAVYGNDWWMPEGTATTAVKSIVNADASMKTGGSGSTSHGTLAKWNSTFNKAKVVAVGVSLGSGSGNTGVVIDKITIGTHNYKFAGKDVPATIEPNVTDTPSGLAVDSVNQSQVKLKWDATPHAKAYMVYLDGNNNPVGASSATNATLTGLKSNTAYKYQVAGVSKDGSIGPKSAIVTATTAKWVFPSPANLKCTATSTTGMHCTSNSVAGANRYSWYANVGTGGTFVAHGSSDAASYDIAGLPTHGTIQVKVAADNDTQSPGPQSGAVSVKLK